MSANDFLSPFEELVLTALQESGNRALDVVIHEKVRDLSGRPRISYNRVQLALRRLEMDYCVYSWGDGSQAFEGRKGVIWGRCYRIQFCGERALKAAVQRHGRPSRDYFYRASRFGILWDVWRRLRSRSRAGRRSWYEKIYGRGENA